LWVHSQFSLILFSILKTASTHQALHNVNPSIEGYNKHHDPLLSKLGESQSLALRAKFQHAPDLVVVSPLQRTLQTALIAFGDFKPPVQYLVSAGE
jgi:broad specificity phosphatase PhoE